MILKTCALHGELTREDVYEIKPRNRKPKFDCKKCSRARAKKWDQQNPDRVRIRYKNFLSKNMQYRSIKNNRYLKKRALELKNSYLKARLVTFEIYENKTRTVHRLPSALVKPWMLHMNRTAFLLKRFIINKNGEERKMVKEISSPIAPSETDAVEYTTASEDKKTDIEERLQKHAIYLMERIDHLTLEEAQNFHRIYGTIIGSIRTELAYKSMHQGSPDNKLNKENENDSK